MSGTVLVAIPQSVADAVAAGRAARDAGIARAEAADPAGIHQYFVGVALEAWAASGRPFSANDLRHLDLQVPGALLGAAFQKASKAGRIRTTGRQVPSTLENTHGKRIDVWIGVPEGNRS